MFKKQLEGTERELYEKRKRLKTAIDGIFFKSRLSIPRFRPHIAQFVQPAETFLLIC